MHRNARFLFLLLWLIPGSRIARADSCEAYSYLAEYTIRQERENRYSLRGQVRIQKTFQSEASLLERYFPIHEPAFVEISSIHVRFNDRRFGSDQMVSEPAHQEDTFIGQGETHTIVLSDAPKPGDELEYSYRLAYSDARHFPVQYVPNREYLSQFEIRLKHPSNMQVELECFFPRDSIPMEVERKGKETRIRCDHVQGADDLELFDFNEIHAAMLFTLRVEDSVISPTTAEALVSWYGSLTDLEPELHEPHPDLNVGNETSGDSIVAAIHAFVRDQIRYIGDSREGHLLVPYAADLVLEKKYGDCKDRASLASAMAREHGESVDMVLISVQPRPRFKGTHPALFDHVICAYGSPGEEVFFDPTTRYFGWGQLPPDYLGKQVLIMDRSHPRMLELKHFTPVPSLALSIDAEAERPSLGRFEGTMRGPWYALLEKLREQSDVATMSSTLSDIFEGILPDMSFSDMRILKSEDYTFHVSGMVDLSRFVVESSRSVYVPKVAFAAVHKSALSRARDSWPLYLNGPFHWKLQLRLKTQGLACQDADTTLGSDDGPRYRARMQTGDSSVTNIHYELNQPLWYADSGSRHLYLDFCEAYLAGRNALFTLKKDDS